jgi:Zn-dependent M16 (insulinase) family peptidase
MKQNPRLLQHVISSNLLDNPHRLLFSMSPDDGYNKSLLEEEQQRLQAKLSALSATDKERIFQEGLELAKAQDSIQGN